jgi:hypothetical protein
MTYFIALKFTGVTIELLSDNEMYEFFSKAKRGGICSVGEKNFSNTYNQPNKVVICIDINSLYPFAMILPLPIGEYSWVSIEEAEKALKTYNFQSDYGYYLEVDIEIPKEIHDKFSAYPLFPEKREGKLVCTFYNKQNYITQLANLQFALKHGYKITKIHRALKFRQSAFLKSYIEYLITERKNIQRELL